MESRNTSSV
jgi:hypothetical protein